MEIFISLYFAIAHQKLAHELFISRSGNNIFIFYILVHKFEIIYYFNYSKFQFFLSFSSSSRSLSFSPLCSPTDSFAANCVHSVFAWKPTSNRETNFALLCSKVYKIFLNIISPSSSSSHSLFLALRLLILSVIG